jgi:hypothetical protein
MVAKNIVIEDYKYKDIQGARRFGHLLLSCVFHIGGEHDLITFLAISSPP